MLVKIMKNIDISVKPIKKILTISSFRGLKRPHSCEIGLMADGDYWGLMGIYSAAINP